MTAVAEPDAPRWAVLVPTLTKQCVGFMIGATLFAVGSAPVFSTWAGTGAANLCFFTGAWFFTGAALVQMLLSGDRVVAVSYSPGVMVRAVWLAAATQLVGTLLFNVSTTSAIQAHSVQAQREFVWFPDAGGSVAFLISGVLTIVGYSHSKSAWQPRDPGWWSVQINLLGCIAFGFSAAGAYITPTGATADNTLAVYGTLAGAVCFFISPMIVLPRPFAARSR